jgi:hypothetical protein
VFTIAGLLGLSVWLIATGIGELKPGDEHFTTR